MMGVLDDDSEVVLVVVRFESVSSSSSKTTTGCDTDSAPLAGGYASLSPGSWELIALN